MKPDVEVTSKLFFESVKNEYVKINNNKYTTNNKV